MITPETRVRSVLGRPGSILGVLTLVVVAVAVELAPRVAVPAHVSTVRIVNPTVYHVNVEVTRSRDDGWLDLGTVLRERTKRLEQITDQGRTWAFRFSYGGVEAGRVGITRSELADAGWTLTIPPDVGERLRAGGFSGDGWSDGRVALVKRPNEVGSLVGPARGRHLRRSQLDEPEALYAEPAGAGHRVARGCGGVRTAAGGGRGRPWSFRRHRSRSAVPRRPSDRLGPTAGGVAGRTGPAAAEGRAPAPRPPGGRPAGRRCPRRDRGSSCS